MEAARLLANNVGRAAFSATLACRTEGPIAGIKATLAWAELELKDMTLCKMGSDTGLCVMGATKYALRGVVLKAIRARDLESQQERGVAGTSVKC